jgi:hypothetical protein
VAVGNAGPLHLSELFSLRLGVGQGPVAIGVVVQHGRLTALGEDVGHALNGFAVVSPQDVAVEGVAREQGPELDGPPPGAFGGEQVHPLEDEAIRLVREERALEVGFEEPFGLFVLSTEVPAQGVPIHAVDAGVGADLPVKVAEGDG